MKKKAKGVDDSEFRKHRGYILSRGSGKKKFTKSERYQKYNPKQFRMFMFMIGFAIVMALIVGSLKMFM